MPELTDLNEDSPAKLSRRNVVVGTAWAVPAIALVGAAPAMALSNPVTLSVTRAKKVFTFTFTGVNAKPGDTVTITSFDPDNIVWVNKRSPVNVSGEFSTSTSKAWVTGQASSNATNTSYSVTFSVAGTGSAVGSHTISAAFTY